MNHRVASLILCILFSVVSLAQSSMISVSRDARLNRTAQLGGKAGVLFHSKSPDLVISTTVNSDPKVTMPKALGNNVYEYEMLLDVSGAADRVFKVSKKGTVMSTKTGQVLLKANAYVGFNVDIVEKPIYMELSDEGGHYILHGNGWALIEINSEIKITPNYSSKLKLEHRSSRSVAGVYVDSLIINVEHLQNLHARLETVRTELDKLNAEYDALLARNTSEGALNRLEKKIREVEATVSSLSKELDELSYISVKGEGTNERVIDAEEILALKSKEKRKYNVILQSKPQDGGATARPSVTSQYVLFKVTPNNAMVELDGQMLEVVDGTTTKRMPFGTYSYRVQAPRHAVKSGTIVVNDPKNKHIVNISLEPQYVNARFSVANNAEIWIDEQKRGTGSCTLELGFGIYMVECRLPGHKPSQQEIQIDRNSATGTITLTPPTPVYGSVDINSTPAEAEVWMDGKKVGTTPMFLSECLVGRHEILLKKSGYKDKKLNFLVNEAQMSAVSESLEKGILIGAVDLGLPSGTLWADRNVGADSPESYGDYFAWGETSPKRTYNWSTYKWCRGSYDTMTKYCTKRTYGTKDKKTVLDLEDDVAYVNMGTEWRMPTYDEQKELKSKCTWTRTTQKGTWGYKVTGPNGKSIFLPAAGYRYVSSLLHAGYFAYYWSASLYKRYPLGAWTLGFNSAYYDTYDYGRSYGYPVRAVAR